VLLARGAPLEPAHGAEVVVRAAAGVVVRAAAEVSPPALAAEPDGEAGPSPEELARLAAAPPEEGLVLLARPAPLEPAHSASVAALAAAAIVVRSAEEVSPPALAAEPDGEAGPQAELAHSAAAPREEALVLLARGGPLCDTVRLWPAHGAGVAAPAAAGVVVRAAAEVFPAALAAEPAGEAGPPPELAHPTARSTKYPRGPAPRANRAPFRPPPCGSLLPVPAARGRRPTP
jgi:hypothetical protein